MQPPEFLSTILAMRRFLALASVVAASGCATLDRAVPNGGAAAGVAFDARGERGAFARGIADPANGRAATPDDPARIASVSKLVVAIGVMKLVEQGRLDLQIDVSPLLGWRLRNPAFPDRPVTLAMLLSHTAGVRDHDDQYAVPLGETVQAAMAQPGSWDRAHAPGTFFTYSNMNFPIIASVMEKATGERFDRWMRREVLDPLRIDACFNWPTCSDGAIARAIVLTQDGKVIRDDLRGRQPDCPVFVREGQPCDLSQWRAGENGALFSPQGGLRISVRGLSRIGRMLLGGGNLDGIRILTPASVATLLQPRWTHDGRNGTTEKGFNCRFGYSTHLLATTRPDCRDDPLGTGRQWIGHAGEAYGLRSGLWIDLERGEGVAYLVTGLDPMPPPGRSAFRAAEERMFRETAALLKEHR